MQIDSSWHLDYFGDLCTVHGFEASDLRLEYMIKVPRGWYPSEERQLYGKTQTCSTNGTDLAAIGHPLEISLKRLERLEHGGDSPSILVRVISIDFWGIERNEGYGQAFLPTEAGRHSITISTWKPIPESLLDRLSEYFLGSASISDDSEENPLFVSENALSRFGKLSASSGNVDLVLNCLKKAE